MAFTQHATDCFTVEVTGPYHCGPDDTSPRQFKFEVTIEYPDDALDEKGFLLDNLTFKQYFNSLGVTDLSCELLCRKATNDLHAMTNGRAYETQVAIWAIPNEAKVVHRVRSA